MNRRKSTLASFEALLGLVDDVDAAATTHELVVAMALHQRLQRVANLHLSTTDWPFGQPYKQKTHLARDPENRTPPYA